MRATFISVRLLLMLTACLAAAPRPALAQSTPPLIADLPDSSGVIGQDVLFWMLRLAPGTHPASTGLTVTLDARPIGSSAEVPFIDHGLTCNDDTTDGVYFSCLHVPIDAPLGPHALTVTVRDAQGRSSSRTATFTVLPALPASWEGAPDLDNDGLPDAWERWYGLDPGSAAGDNGAAGDPDGDGRSNLQELEARTHPRGLFTYHFAEGASNAFFATRVTLFNPGDAPAAVDVIMLGETGTRRSTSASRGALTIGGFGELPLRVDGLDPPGSAFSIQIESDRPLAVDRLMAWAVAPHAPAAPSDDRFEEAYGSSLEQATAAPSQTWFFAEGATGGPFSLYYLLNNPGDQPAEAIVTYLRAAPLTPIVKAYPLPAHSRVTIDVAGEDPGLAAGDVSASITADRPIVAERAMYYSTPGQTLAAGHAGAGLTTASTHWLMAEGATGFFDEFVLIANPGTQAASVTVTYLLPDGAPLTETVPVAANSRFTIPVNSRFPALAATPVAVALDSPVPIVAERVMWWPHGAWHEASLSAGATETGTRWAFAESRTVAGRISTFVLIANSTDRAGEATITRYGTYPLQQRTVPLPPRSRTSVDLATLQPENQTRGAGVIVQSDGIPIVVERSTYSTPANGPFWAAGATALATRLP